MFYQKGRKLIFCFGFSKNEQDNLNNAQLTFLHKLSDGFQKTLDEAIMEAIKQKRLMKIGAEG